MSKLQRIVLVILAIYLGIGSIFAAFVAVFAWSPFGIGSFIAVSAVYWPRILWSVLLNLY